MSHRLQPVIRIPTLRATLSSITFCNGGNLLYLCWSVWQELIDTQKLSTGGNLLYLHWSNWQLHVDTLKLSTAGNLYLHWSIWQPLIHTQKVSTMNEEPNFRFQYGFKQLHLAIPYWLFWTAGLWFRKAPSMAEMEPLWDLVLIPTALANTWVAP